MLFYIAPILIAFGIAGLTGMTSSYDKIGNSIIAFFVSFVISFGVFALIVPGIATASSDVIERSDVHDIQDVSLFSTHNMNGSVIAVSYYDKDTREAVVIGEEKSSDDRDHFEFIYADVVTPTATRACDATPDWVAPYNIGGCWTEIVMPKDMAVTLK